MNLLEYLKHCQTEYQPVLLAVGGRPVRIVAGQILAIDQTARQALLTSGATIDFDQVVGFPQPGL